MTLLLPVTLITLSLTARKPGEAFSAVGVFISVMLRLLKLLVPALFCRFTPAKPAPPAFVIWMSSKVWTPELLTTLMPSFCEAIVAETMPGVLFLTVTSPAALETRIPSPVSWKGLPGSAVRTTSPPSVPLT